jgi:hypothetical protein
VTLAYGNFHAYYRESYQELFEYRKNRRDLLAQLAIEKPWPAIVTLQISIATDYSTLLNFLETIASSLRTLWLDSVTLLPNNGKRDTWEHVLPCIPAGLPMIECLVLVDLNDFQTDESTRKLFHSSAWKCEDCYREYEDTIVKGLLDERKLHYSLELEKLSDCKHSLGTLQLTLY